MNQNWNFQRGVGGEGGGGSNPKKNPLWVGIDIFWNSSIKGWLGLNKIVK